LFFEPLPAASLQPVATRFPCARRLPQFGYPAFL